MAIKRFGDYAATKAYGNYTALPKGGYVMRILSAIAKENSVGQYIEMELDIAEGEYRDFYKRDYEDQQSEDKKWRCRFFLNVPKDDGTEKDGWTKRRFKTFTEALEDSNAGYHFDWNPRKRTGQEFDNDDIAGSSNITNLVDVVMRYARPKGKDIPPDTAERELKVYKNRLTGQTNRVGIKLFYEPESKRISESSFCFDWELGWEERYEQMEFIPLADDVQTPFDEEADHDEE